MIYGAAALAGGSGFLAVFVAGVIIGDARVPGQREITRFHSALASLAEIVAFAMLGLTMWLSRRLRLPERDHGPFPPLAQGAFTPAQHGVTCHQHVAASLTTPRAAGGDRGMRPPGNAASTPWADVLSDLRERRRP